jgi:protein involved in polysaccharide export with SLBB domain
MKIMLTVFFIINIAFSPVAFSQKLRMRGENPNFSTLRYTQRSTAIETFFQRIPKISTDYQLGAGDELKIEIIGQDLLSESLKALRINQSGEISIPFLGSIQTADLTAAELEAKIASLLKEKKLVSNPEVLVFITDYLAKPIWMIGALDYPGVFMMSQQMTLMEGILMAGGIDFIADRYGFLHRRKSLDGPDLKPESLAEKPDVARQGEEVIKIDLKPMKEGGIINPNPVLRKGDTFVIPPRTPKLFYLIGDVYAAGAYEIPPPPERTFLVSQAIAQGGGPLRTAKMSKGMVVRHEGNGSRVEKKVDFAAILKGQQPDFEVRPNDIIFIPGSKAKTLGYGLIGAVPNIAQQSTRR